MTDKKRKTYSDTPSRLGEVRRAWLMKRFGCYQQGIRQLIDAEMAKEGRPAYVQLLAKFESESYARGGANFDTAQHFTMLLFADWLDAQETQPCGHPRAAIVGGTTQHCSECERAAQALSESPGPRAQAGEVEE